MIKNISNIKDFENTNLFADFNIGFRKFITTKYPYSYFSEGVYDYYEKLLVFVLYKDDDYEYMIDKLDTAYIIEHKSNADSADNYYETKKPIKEQLESYNYEGVIIYYSHSNSWNDDKVNEKIYITSDNIKKIEEEEAKGEEELKHQSGKHEKQKEVSIKEDSNVDIRYLPEEDI